MPWRAVRNGGGAVRTLLTAAEAVGRTVEAIHVDTWAKRALIVTLSGDAFIAFYGEVEYGYEHGDEKAILRSVVDPWDDVPGAMLEAGVATQEDKAAQDKLDKVRWATAERERVAKLEQRDRATYEALRARFEPHRSEEHNE